jgi:glutamine amidotransferase/cyclase
MQVLFSSSTESPNSRGLAIIDSPIAEFDNAGKPVPHMGWNSVRMLAATSEDRLRETAETGMSARPEETYYFLHSYRATYVPALRAASEWGHTVSQYGRELFLATVRKGNVFACQFHPEKSGRAGLKILRGWLESPTHVVDQEYPSPSKRFITMNEMDGFTKRIIACMDVRANDDGDLVVTKGDQYQVREREVPEVIIAPTTSADPSEIPSSSITPNVAASSKRQVRNLGKPVALALRYFESGADEICFLNITSFRNSPLHDQPMLGVLQEAASRIFVPLTVGGGIKDTIDPDGTPRTALEVAGAYFRAGADKVSIGSEAVAAVERLRERGNVPTGTTAIETIARVYGRQAVVVSVDPKRVFIDSSAYNPETAEYSGPYADELIRGSNALSPRDASDVGRAWWYQCTIKGGREARPISVKQLAQGVELLGAGEILVNSIDRDGTNSGFDLDLVDLVRRSVRIPVVASSGAGNAAHFVDVFERTGVEAALAAGIFHRGEVDLSEVKAVCQSRGVVVRLG